MGLAMGNAVQFIESKIFNFVVLQKLVELKWQEDFARNTERHTKRMIRSIVRAAMKHQIYRDKFAKAGLDPAKVDSPEELERLEPLTKDEYRSMVEEALASDTNDRYKWCHKDHTSGSTGKPLYICFSVEEYATIVAQLLYILNKNGYRLFRDSSLDMSSPVHKGTRRAKSILQRFGLLEKYYVSTMDDPRDIIKTINEVKPTEMLAGKSVMHSVLQYAVENGLHIYPSKIIVNSAEPMDDRAAELIEHFFGPDALIDTYATVESGILAYTMRGDRHKFHLNNSHYLYTIIGPDGLHSDDGELFITNLFFKQFPVINYKQGDRVKSFVDVDGNRYLTQVLGRNDDCIITRDGKRFSFHYLFAFMPRYNIIEQYRVIQEDYDRIRMVLVPRKNVDIDKEELERELAQQLNTYMKDNQLQCEFEWVDSLPLDANGKIRVIISKMSSEN